MLELVKGKLVLHELLELFERDLAVVVDVNLAKESSGLVLSHIVAEGLERALPHLFLGDQPVSILVQSLEQDGGRFSSVVGDLFVHVVQVLFPRDLAIAVGV